MAEIKPEQIPDEVYEAWHAAFFSDEGGRAAIAAALNAWPGMVPEYCIPKANGWMPSIILPVPPQEASDAL